MLYLHEAATIRPHRSPGCDAQGGRQKAGSDQQALVHVRKMHERRKEMFSSFKWKSLMLVAFLFVATGCASRLDGGTYERGEARREMRVTFATVESVRPVLIEGTKSYVGTMAGAAIGGIAGSSIGGNSKESAAGAVIGSVVGGIAGSAVEEAVTRERGMEITIRLDNGEYRAVVQSDDGENFQPGERVRLVKGSNATRVTR
jgi:outer membrane lipoprotein SlyB